MPNLVFDNLHQISLFVIQKRLKSIDPFGLAEIYIVDLIDVNHLPTGQQKNYIAITSTLSDNQLSGICSQPMTASEQGTIDRFLAAKAEASLATEIRTLTPRQVVDYIETNVTSLASAKTVLKIMARVLIALRDETWPDMAE